MQSKSIIYVKLLDEGVTVFRPVFAISLGGDKYQIDDNSDIYNPDDEVWEFLPGDIVETGEENLSDGIVLAAKRLARPVNKLFQPSVL